MNWNDLAGSTYAIAVPAVAEALLRFEEVLPVDTIDKVPLKFVEHFDTQNLVVSITSCCAGTKSIGVLHEICRGRSTEYIPDNFASLPSAHYTCKRPVLPKPCAWFDDLSGGTNGMNSPAVAADEGQQAKAGAGFREKESASA